MEVHVDRILTGKVYPCHIVFDNNDDLCAHAYGHVVFSYCHSLKLQLTLMTYDSFPSMLCWPERCENIALFLRIGLPSTLMRHENRATE